MKIKWHGHSCFEITLENGAVIVTDPFDETVGYPVCESRADIALLSHGHFDHNHHQSLSGDPTVLSEAGKWDLHGAVITGVHSFHDPEKGALRGENILFGVEAEGMRVVHLGDLGHMPETDDQKAIIKNADLLLIPIGGTFTITTAQAMELINLYHPKAAIAMHYQNEYCKFNITTCDEFVSLTGAKTLPNEITLTAGALSGCHIMKI